MQNEIELKLMLQPQVIPALKAWVELLPVLSSEIETLGNAYYDTVSGYFAERQMGLRVRTKNNRYEMTLKTQGEIIGGLHIRPEYNCALPSAEPDFSALRQAHNLQNFPQIDPLVAVFSTDFTREKWLVAYRASHIEIALDQGMIENAFGREPICELELELKQGDLADIFALLHSLPSENGIWLSSLSKAQRGYQVGQPAVLQAQIERLQAGDFSQKSANERVKIQQQIADLIRQSPHEQPALTQRFWEIDALMRELFDCVRIAPIRNWQALQAYLKSYAYFQDSLIRMIQIQ